MDLDLDALRSALVAPAGPYAAVDLVGSTGSTNADLVAAAAAGAADRTVLIAGEQTAGRGRRGRDWVSPAGSGLYLSVLLRPAGVPVAQFGSLALVAGVALVRAARHAGVEAALKWPNDLLAGSAKCAGVLAEAVAEPAPAVVVGIGLNVGPLPDAVPAGPGALAPTSLAQQGGTADRQAVAVALLRAFAELEAGWRGSRGDLATSGLLAEYRANSATIGREVRIELPDGRSETGVASDVDRDGRLVLAGAAGTARAVSAGDVVHLRPMSP